MYKDEVLDWEATLNPWVFNNTIMWKVVQWKIHHRKSFLIIWHALFYSWLENFYYLVNSCTFNITVMKASSCHQPCLEWWWPWCRELASLVGHAFHWSGHFLLIQSWADRRLTPKSEYELFRLQTSVASQSNWTSLLHPSPSIQRAAAHLQIHQEGFSRGHLGFLPWGP